MTFELSAEDIAPTDGFSGNFIGRVQLTEPDGTDIGPAVVQIMGEDVFDLSDSFPTVAHLLEVENPVTALASVRGKQIGRFSEIASNSAYTARKAGLPYFLSPIDLQAVKACGVTFVRSMLERVVEEKAKGDPDLALSIRQEISEDVGGALTDIVPGSEAAARVKDILIQRGLWSQYLEVGIGPDAEVFTKCQIMASVGTGSEIGIRDDSTWNNPEPEVVLILNPSGQIVGASLGNDVNLRDFEGRSALLLSLAKDNRASSAIGPFIRLFDESFSLDDVRNMEVGLEVVGEDGFQLTGSSSMAEISRDPADLARAAMGRHHQYPDGAALYTGTMFAPTEDRDAPGQGFTHHIGDQVRISTPALGSLVNQINYTDKIAPWTFGVGALMRNLAKRKLH